MNSTQNLGNKLNKIYTVTFNMKQESIPNSFHEIQLI